MLTSLATAFVAFLIAATITGLELITSKYPRTYFLLYRCTTLYAYIAIYAVLGLGTTLLLPYLPVKIGNRSGQRLD